MMISFAMACSYNVVNSKSEYRNPCLPAGRRNKPPTVEKVQMSKSKRQMNAKMTEYQNFLFNQFCHLNFGFHLNFELWHLTLLSSICLPFGRLKSPLPTSRDWNTGIVE